LGAAALCLSAAAPCPVTAQGRAADSVAAISVAFIGVPVAEALGRLAELGRLNLVWSTDVLAAAARGRSARVTCRLTEAAPEAVLRCIVREAGLDFYRLSSGTYVVIARAEDAPGYASLAALVVDGASGTPIPAARIRLAEVPAPRLSNGDGVVAFDRLAPGRYDVLVQAVGYRPLRLELDLPRAGTVRHRFALQRTAAVVTPIVINSLAAASASRSLGGSTLDEAAAAALRGPALFVPGTMAVLGVSRRDGVGDLHIQGGDVGEHPWHLDGVPLFDAAALSGLVGVVAAPAIERLTVQRAGFRAANGSFTVGTIDLAHALGDEGVRARPAVRWDADPLSTSVRLTSPWTAGGVRGQGMLAARQGLWRWTAPGALARAIRDWNVPDPVLLDRLTGFSALPGLGALDAATFEASGGSDDVAVRDLHAAVRLELPGFQWLDASLFGTSNGLRREGRATDADARAMHSSEAFAWHTTGGQVAHRALLGRGVLQRVQLRAVTHRLSHAASMGMTGVVPIEMAGHEANRIREIGLRSEWTVTGAERWDLTAGLDLADSRARLDLANRVLRPLDITAAVGRFAAFGDANWRLGGGHWLETGLRITQLTSGRTFGEPRLALRGESAGDRDGAPAVAWRLAGGGFHQFVNQFDVATTSPVAVTPSVRFWLPTDGRQGVPTAWHLAGEWVLRPWRGWEVRADAFARWHPTVLAFDYGALYADGGDGRALGAAAEVIRSARGQAVGGGVRVSHERTLLDRPLRLDLGYDGGSAARTSPSRFGGTAQPVPWLEPHRLLFAIEATPASGLVLAARGSGVWGRPWALRQAYYDLFGAAPMAAGLPLDDPGAMRRPAVIDVDVGVTWDRRVGRADLQLGASVTNLLDRRNVLDFGLRRDTAPGVYVMVPRYLPGRQAALTLRVRS
jgi:hypothetical protein